MQPRNARLAGIEARAAQSHMRAMRLQAISLLLHAYVGWRLVPALGSLAAGVALAIAPRSSRR